MFGSDAFTAFVNRSCVDLSTLNVAHVGAARRVDDELREHFAFDVRRAKHVGIPRRRIARERRHLLLDLELEVRLVVVDRLRRSADDTLGDTAGDALTREVLLVRDLLGEVDVGEHVGDLDRRGQHLEAFRRRCLHDHFRRRWLGSSFGGGGSSFLTCDEFDLLRLRLLELLSRVQRPVHRRR